MVERPGSSRNLRAEWRRCGGGYGADGTVLDVGGRDSRERRRRGTPRARDGVADRPAPPGLTRFCGSRETSGRPARRRRWRGVPGRAAGLTVATAVVVLAGAASATAVDAAPAVELPAASTTGPSGGGATALSQPDRGARADQPERVGREPDLCSAIREHRCTVHEPLAPVRQPRVGAFLAGAFLAGAEPSRRGSRARDSPGGQHLDHSGLVTDRRSVGAGSCRIRGHADRATGVERPSAP